jgi:hypothetical protein
MLKLAEKCYLQLHSWLVETLVLKVCQLLRAFSEYDAMMLQFFSCVQANESVMDVAFRFPDVSPN